MKYGWKYVFEPTPKNVSKWLLAIRGIFGVIQTAAVLEHASIGTQLAIIAIGGALHELGTMFGSDINEKGTAEESSTVSPEQTLL